MRMPGLHVIRATSFVTMVVALAALFVIRADVALAHHVEIETSYTCDTYTFRVDYIGGSGDRYAEVRVNGVLTQTIQLPGSDPDFLDDIFVLTGPLPTNTTVEVRLYVPPTNHLESTASATINQAMTCTPTATPTATDTPEPTDTPQPTTTPDVPTQTPPATSTPVEPTPSATNVPATSTPQPNTSTPVPPTSTPAVGETPTFVSTVESLGPAGPDEGNSGSPPEETASGLPNAGSGAPTAQISVALVLLALGASGLGLTTWGLRQRS